MTYSAIVRPQIRRSFRHQESEGRGQEGWRANQGAIGAMGSMGAMGAMGKTMRHGETHGETHGEHR